MSPGAKPAACESTTSPMAKPLINHRGPEYARLLHSIAERMQSIFATSGDVLLLGASGTGSLEAAVTNMFGPGDIVLACPTGVFGERIATIAVPTLLATFNWRHGSPRYRRVARFVDELYGRVDKLQSPGFDAKWKDVNLKTRAPGLERFQAAQEWLDRTSSTKQSGQP